MFLRHILILGTVLLGAQASFGSLILQSPIQQSGAGLGTEPTLLTIHNNTTTETGCVGSTSSATGAVFGTQQTGNPGMCLGSASDVSIGTNAIGPQTLSSAGITSASNFGIVFNAAQTGGGPIDLTQLTAAFYSPDGKTVLYQTSGVSCPGLTLSQCNFLVTNQGTGTSGYVFVLSSDQALAATNAGVFKNLNDLVGLSGSVTGANGGNETFYLATATPTAPGPSPTPEPGTWMMLSAGLAFVCIGGYRKSVVRK